MNAGENVEFLISEYEQIAENIRHCVTILWEAFKTYFTVVALLFAAYYNVIISPGEHPSTAATGLVKICHLVLPAGGVLVTALACLAIRRIMQHESALIARGVEVELALGARRGQLTGASELFKHKVQALDGLAYVVLALFGAGWIAMFDWS